VPGMRSMFGARCSSQASAVCIGVAPNCAARRKGRGLQRGESAQREEGHVKNFSLKRPEFRPSSRVLFFSLERAKICSVSKLFARFNVSRLRHLRNAGFSPSGRTMSAPTD
jgi:hypothetical protein